ncbi:hypothetical protein D6D22_09468 [Aureobasidium pullulans]|uniref:Uncharacterized protein n=1 Tax=Aureobasidium pullulans TaxID=5580 RepID=A0A4S8X361_AURPU|nr:hypothetical protein D6D22_09468 [Aureobasidium pullulans]
MLCKSSNKRAFGVFIVDSVRATSVSRRAPFISFFMKGSRRFPKAVSTYLRKSQIANYRHNIHHGTESYPTLELAAPLALQNLLPGLYGHVYVKLHCPVESSNIRRWFSVPERSGKKKGSLRFMEGLHHICCAPCLQLR